MRFRPVKFVVQVIGVIEDDDGNLTEQATEPRSVAAKEWRAFADEGGQFDQALDSLKASIEGPPSPPSTNA